jgi:hypothetical protein
MNSDTFIIIPILLNVRTLSVVEVFGHLDYCSKLFEKSSKLFEKSSKLFEKSSKLFEKSSKLFEKSSTTYYLKLLNIGIIHKVSFINIVSYIRSKNFIEFFLSNFYL